MNIYRNNKDKKLYIIYRVSPIRYTGIWYEAEPYNHQGKKIKLSTEKDIDRRFTIVSER